MKPTLSILMLILLSGPSINTYGSDNSRTHKEGIQSLKSITALQKSFIKKFIVTDENGVGLDGFDSISRDSYDYFEVPNPEDFESQCQLLRKDFDETDIYNIEKYTRIAGDATMIVDTKTIYTAAHLLTAYYYKTDSSDPIQGIGQSFKATKANELVVLKCGNKPKFLAQAVAYKRFYEEGFPTMEGQDGVLLRPFRAEDQKIADTIRPAQLPRGRNNFSDLMMINETRGFIIQGHCLFRGGTPEEESKLCRANAICRFVARISTEKNKEIYENSGGFLINCFAPGTTREVPVRLISGSPIYVFGDIDSEGRLTISTTSKKDIVVTGYVVSGNEHSGDISADLFRPDLR